MRGRPARRAMGSTAAVDAAAAAAAAAAAWSAVLPLALGFFVAQVLQELTMEGLFAHFDGLPDSEGLSLAATFAQFLGCIAVPMVVGGVSGGKQTKALAAAAAEPEPLPALVSWLPFVGLTALVMTTNMLGTQAVHYVDYPVKVVFKSTKLIPTMLISTAMGNARNWSILDYSAALLLCGSAASFAFSASSTPKQGEKAHLARGQALIGIGMLVTAVCADALVPNCQQWVLRIRQGGTEQLMVRVNVRSTSQTLSHPLKPLSAPLTVLARKFPACNCGYSHCKRVLSSRARRCWARWGRR